MSAALYEPVVQRFLDGLGGRLDRLAEGLSTLGGEGRETLRAEAHRIAGTAGSMGFPALGTAALSLEVAVAEAAPDADLRALTEALMAAATGLSLRDSELLSDRP